MKDHEPHESNRAYYIPCTNVDIRNHIDAAKAAIQFSKFDQVNLKAMVDAECKKAGRYFFRPFIKKKKKKAHLQVVKNLLLNPPPLPLLQPAPTLHLHVPSSLKNSSGFIKRSGNRKYLLNMGLP